jgi:hypothetical protein
MSDQGRRRRGGASPPCHRRGGKPFFSTALIFTTITRGFVLGFRVSSGLVTRGEEGEENVRLQSTLDAVHVLYAVYVYAPGNQTSRNLM